MVRRKQGLSSVSSPERSGRLNLDFSHLGEEGKISSRKGKSVYFFVFLLCFTFS